MLIDENKIQQLVEKEIKQQVENKLRSIGREAIINIYKNEIHNVISKELRNKENEFTETAIKSFVEDRDWIKEQVADRTSDRLIDYFIEGVEGKDY